jgi:hypothetical protein
VDHLFGEAESLFEKVEVQRLAVQGDGAINVMMAGESIKAVAHDGSACTVGFVLDRKVGLIVGNIEEGLALQFRQGDAVHLLQIGNAVGVGLFQKIFRGVTLAGNEIRHLETLADIVRHLAEATGDFVILHELDAMPIAEPMI